MPPANIVAIIPARGGSKGLPRKNLRLLAGKPLLAYAIEAARSAPAIQRVIVSTDDEEIAGVARRWGAEVPFLRPAGISGDEATTESVLQHAVLWLDEHEGSSVEIVVFLTCSTVYRETRWVNEVVKRLLDDATLDSAFVALKTHKNFWRRRAEGWERLAADIPYASRQVREPLYREETPAACATRASWIRKGRRLGPRVDLVVTDDERVALDIHTEFDLWLAEKILVEWPKERGTL